MYTTSATLLECLCRPAAHEAWRRFVELYTPLLLGWARRLAACDEDAEDLVQDVFVVLVRKLPEFRYDGNRRFRGWLFTLVRHTWQNGRRRHQVPTESLGERDPPADDGADEVADVEYARYLAARTLELLQAEFEAKIWKAFWGCAVQGRPAKEVAAELGMTLGAVYAATARVLRRLRELRQYFRELLD